MYLHIGHDILVPTRSIIALLNRDLLETSPEFRHLYNRLRMDGKVTGDPQEAKTVILTSETIYLSNISSQTLVRRAERISPLFE